MDNDKMPTVEDAFLDALDVLWRQHGNDDPGYKAMLPFAKQIAELQAEANEQARLNGMGAEREARMMAQIAELRAERDELVSTADAQAVDQWQPIETAPKDGTIIIVAGAPEIGYTLPCVVDAFYDEGGWQVNQWESPSFAITPTHWMPIPPLGQQAGKGGA